MFALLLSPIGRWLAFAAVAAVLVSGAYVKGRLDCGANAALAAARAELAAAKADLTAAANAAERASEVAAENVKAAEAAENLVKEYADELAKRGPAGACALTPADVRRLRD
jgi:hypothetical protein